MLNAISTLCSIALKTSMILLVLITGGVVDLVDIDILD